MGAWTSQTEPDYTCPVSYDIFQDPVVLSYGHSFSRNCLQQCWRQSSQQACPVCRKEYPNGEPAPNLALRNLCDAFRIEKSQKVNAASEEMCSVHDEKLKLFCEEDQQVICVICRDSKKHKNHNCVPINEAAEAHRTKIKAQLMSLKSKLGSFQREKCRRDDMSRHITFQAVQTEKTIEEEFQKLHQFLRDEKAARLDALWMEVMLKSTNMEAMITELAPDISALTLKITNVEEEMKAEDVPFMLKLKDTVKLSQCNLAEPETPTEALIDETKHVGNLLFTVWKKMENLIQHDKMTRSTTSDKSQPLPENPERLNGAVLGSEGFDSWKHSWDVEVEGDWLLV